MIPPKINIAELPQLTLERLIESANNDSDAASVLALGTNLESMPGIVVVVRGNVAAQVVREFLICVGLLTPGKGIRDDGQALTGGRRGMSADICLDEVAHGEPIAPRHCACKRCKEAN